MDVRVLGGVQVVSDPPLVLGGPTQRRLLAALALRRNEVVSVSYLVDVIWPDGAAPDRAEHNVRTYVHRLRTALDGAGDRVETVGLGYRIRLEADELDAARFEQFARTAARLADTGDVVATLDVLDQADTLWRGAPLEEFAHEAWAMPDVVRLLELRSGVRAGRAAALIDAGRPTDAIALLEALVRDEPLRERPRGLLMRALYESGRQAEALRCFHEFRRMLVDEIGVEPSAELVALDRAIATGSLHPSSDRSRSVGGYELHERIGEGAFAVVHRATQLALGREVAVKIVRAELANRPEFIRRFEAEAQMVARIEHPNVVPLYDYWREPDRAFLVMRWMVGGSLESRLDDGPWALGETVTLVDQIASALDAAHEMGVVHRDVKPANILFDGEGRAFLGDFGIALAAEERSRPEAALSEGSPVFASPEQLRRQPVGPEADVHSLAIVAFTLLTGRTPFADTRDQPTLVQRQLHDPIPSVRSLRVDLPGSVDDVLTVATAKDPSARYPSAGAFATAFRTAVNAGAAGSPSLPLRPRANPYKGLRPFDETDAADFHGRGRLVDELLTHLAQPDHRLLAVVGPSGSGKSSVVRAGLIPALRANRVRGSSQWFTTTMIPGTNPFEALEAALLRVAVNPPSELLGQLRDGDRGILRSVKRILPDDCGVVVVVIDQFEEVFTAGVSDDDRDLFLRGIAVAASEPRSPVTFVLTLRADFYDRPLRHPQFAPLLKRHTVAVTPLAPDELEHAIVTPAAAVGVGFDPGLVAEMIADVNHEPGALPLLQYALTQAFDRTGGDSITVESYRSIGGLAGALGQRAEELWRAADAGERSAVRRMFGRLVTLGDGTEDTRRRVHLAELDDTPDTRAAVDRFGDARLLTFDHDPVTRQPTVEVAHEALIREWPRLRAWLDEDRDALRAHRHLTAATAAWLERDGDPNELYRGARLETAEQFLGSGAVSLNHAESDFLQASVRQQQDERAAERRRVRRLHRLVAATAVVAALALVAGAVAAWQRQRADEQRAAAEAAADHATAAEADTAFINLTNTSLLERGNRQDLAALLAIEAYRIDPERSRSALFSTFTRNVGFVGYRPLEGASAVLGVVPLAGGTDALAALDGGRLVRFDLASGSTVQMLDPIDSVNDAVDEATMLRLSGDGRIAVLAVQGGEAVTWRAYDATSGEPVSPPVTVPFAPSTDQTRPEYVATYGDASLNADGALIAAFGDAGLSADGALLAIGGGATGSVLVFNTTDGSVVGSADFPPPPGWTILAHTASVMFDTDNTLWVGVPDGRVLTIDPNTAGGGQLRVVNRFPGSMWSTEYGLRLGSSDDGGRYLITFGSGAVSRIDLPAGTTAWTNTSGSENLPVKPEADAPRLGFVPCRDVVVSTASQHLYCADDFGSVFEQDVATGARTPRLFDRQTGVTGPLALTVDQKELLASSYSDEAVAAWKLDGSGPIQRVIASEVGSVATFGYNSTATLLNSSEELYDPSLWNPVTGEMTDPLDPVIVGTWADAPDRFWATFIEEDDDVPRGWVFTGGLYDPTTKAPVPGVRIEFEGNVVGVPWNDTAHHRMLLLFSDNVKVFDQLGNYIGPTIRIAEPGTGINTAQSSADGTKLVISVNGQTSLYDAITGAKLDVPSLPLVASVVSPNGVAVGSTVEGDLWIFDPDTLEKLGELPGLHGYAEHLVLNPDGTTLAADNESDGIRIYDVPSRTQLGENIPDVDGALGFFAMRPDGLELAIPYGDLGLVLWDLDPQHWLDAACSLAGRNLTQQEWDKYLGSFGQYHQSCNGDLFNP